MGIAEQHAVTFAAGLAAGGMKPFARFIRPSCNAATRSCMTWRSSACRCVCHRPRGLVGADGATHAGAYRRGLPREPAWHGGDGGPDEAELAHMVATAVAHDAGPIASAIRAARAPASRCPNAPNCLRSVAAASSPRARASRSCPGTACPRSCGARGAVGMARHPADCGRCAVRRETAGPR